MVGMQVYVTPKDIRLGIAGICAECPTALAIQRRVKPLGYIVASVSGRYVSTFGNMAAFHFKPTDSVVAFVAAFDDYEPVKPFRFKLPDIPLASTLEPGSDNYHESLALP